MVTFPINPFQIENYPWMPFENEPFFQVFFGFTAFWLIGVGCLSHKETTALDHLMESPQFNLV